MKALRLTKRIGAYAGMSMEEIVAEVWAFVTTDQSLHEILQVIGVLCLALASLSVFLRREGPGTWLPSRTAAPAKRACEVWFLGYGAFWIPCFAVVIALRSYDAWEHEGYLLFMLGLMSPLILQPVVFPSLTCDQGRRLTERYSFKANLWIFIFGFVGNYWYTHYFYSVLKASYTFKSWDLNGVPIPMFFATHFYFCFYHTLANMALRKVPLIGVCTNPLRAPPPGPSVRPACFSLTATARRWRRHTQRTGRAGASPLLS